VFVARHCPSKTLVVVKQTNVDVQNAEQLEELKVCALWPIITSQENNHFHFHYHYRYHHLP